MFRLLRVLMEQCLSTDVVEKNNAPMGEGDVGKVYYVPLLEDVSAYVEHIMKFPVYTPVEVFGMHAGAGMSRNTTLSEQPPRPITRRWRSAW